MNKALAKMPPMPAPFFAGIGVTLTFAGGKFVHLCACMRACMHAHMRTHVRAHMPNTTDTNGTVTREAHMYMPVSGKHTPT